MKAPNSPTSTGTDVVAALTGNGPGLGPEMGVDKIRDLLFSSDEAAQRRGQISWFHRRTTKAETRLIPRQLALRQLRARGKPPRTAAIRSRFTGTTGAPANIC